MSRILSPIDRRLRSAAITRRAERRSLPNAASNRAARGASSATIPNSAFSEKERGSKLIDPIELTTPSRSEERREGKSVDLGGRRIIKKKKYRSRSVRFR